MPRDIVPRLAVRWVTGLLGCVIARVIGQR